MKIKNVVRNIKKKNKLRKINKYIQLDGSSVYMDHFNIDLRQIPYHEKNFLKVGKNSIIGGNFIFETDKGQIIVGNRCHIGGGNFISRELIEIGNDVTIAWDVTLYDHDSHSINWNERKNDTIQEYKDWFETGNMIKNKNWDVVKSAPIRIKDKVWIGMGVTVLKGVTIGEGAVVGAKSVVTKDVEPWTVVGGNPAKFLKKIER